MRNDPSPAPPWLPFTLSLGAALALLGATFFPLWKPLCLGAVLAGAVADLHERLAHRLRQRRALSAGVMTVALVLLVLLPLVTLATVALRELVAGTNWVRQALQDGGVAGLTRALPDRLERWVQKLVDLLPAGALPGQAASGGRWAAGVLGDALSATSTVLLQLVLALIAFYFFLVEGPRMGRWFDEASPLRAGQTAELLRDFRRMSRSVLGSVVGTAAVQGVAATIGYAIARTPHPLFFGLLTFVAAFIPAVGTAVVALPLALLMLLLGHPWAALFLAVWSIVVVGSVDNLIKPLLLRLGSDLHGAVIFFALLGGLAMWGPVGLAVGPLSVTFFLAMLRFVRREREARTES